MEEFQCKQDMKHMMKAAFASRTNAALSRVGLPAAPEALLAPRAAHASRSSETIVGALALSETVAFFPVVLP